MKTPYKDLEYASGRLYQTIVRLDGEPVYVMNTMGDEYEVKTLKSGLVEICNYTELDTNPFELGNIENNDGGTSYLVRAPSRQWKQGFRTAQILNTGWNMPSIWSKAFYNMLSGTYKGLEETYELLINQERRRLPLTRHFSLSTPKANGKLPLTFKNTVVGEVTPKTKIITPEFNKNFTFLTEFFEDSTLKVRP